MNKKKIYGKQKKRKKNSASPVKYQTGGAFSWDPSSFIGGNLSALQGLSGLGSGLIQEFSDPNEANYGSNIGSGLLTGAASGAAFGPIGMGVGALVGGISGLIGSGKRRQELKRAKAERARQYGLQSTANLNPDTSGTFETTNYFPIFEDGGPIKGNRMYTKTKGGKYYSPNPAYTRGWRARIDGDNEIPITEAEFQKNRLSNNYITRYYDIEDSLPYNVPDEFFMNPELLTQQKVALYTDNALDSTTGLLADSGSRKKMEKGGIVQDLYPFMDAINIEEGEALVNFNKGKGEILYKYYDDGEKFNGVNPITGTPFEPHKKRGKDPKANFIPVPEAGEFVISKDYAKKYEDAYKHNDKIAIGTIKQNILNDNILASKGETKGRMKYGGAIPKKQLGGDPFLPFIPELSVFGTPRNFNSTLPSSGNINPADIGLDIESRYSPAYINPAQEALVDNRNNVSGTLSELARVAPSMYNIFRGLSGAEVEGEISQPVSQYTSAAENNLPERLNYNRLFDRVFSNRNVGQRQIMDNTSSPSVRRANLQQLYSNTNRALGDAFFQGEGINRQIDAQRSNFYSGLAAQDLEGQYRTDATNRQIRAGNQANRAAARDLIGAGLSGLSSYSQVRSQERQQRNNDLMRIQAINDILGNYSVSPAVRDYIMNSGMSPEQLSEGIRSGLYTFNAR